MIDLSSIEFPVYAIKSHDAIIREDNGEVYIDTGFNQFLIDDTSLSGDLGLRRLQLKVVKKKLYPLKEMFTTFALLIARKDKMNKKFIDSQGQIFKYVTKHRMKVVYKRVRKQVIKEGRHTLVYLEDDMMPVKVSRPLPEGVTYLGIGTLNGKHILIDISHTKKRTSWRKI